jgi:hypothetical protein
MATASLPPGFGGPVLGLPADQIGQNISLHHLRHHLQQARVSKKVSWAAGDRLCQVIPFFLLLHSCCDLSCKLHVSFVLVRFSSSSSSSIKNAVVSLVMNYPLQLGLAIIPPCAFRLPHGERPPPCSTSL